MPDLPNHPGVNMPPPDTSQFSAAQNAAFAKRVFDNGQAALDHALQVGAVGALPPDASMMDRLAAVGSDFVGGMTGAPFQVGPNGAWYGSSGMRVPGAPNLAAYGPQGSPWWDVPGGLSVPAPYQPAAASDNPAVSGDLNGASYANGGSMNPAQFNALSAPLQNIQSNTAIPAGHYTGGPPADLAITADMQQLSGLIRYQYNPNFLVQIFGNSTTDPNTPIEDFNLVGIGPNLNEDGETDLAMLQRILPSYGWSLTPYAIWPNCTHLATSGEYSYDAFYAPLGGGWAMPGGVGASSLLKQFYHLWDYTPSSGGALRNGIDDFMTVLSMLPIQFP